MSSELLVWTDGKPWLSPFDRYQNHKKWTSPSKVMAISNSGLWFWWFIYFFVILFYFDDFYDFIDFVKFLWFFRNQRLEFEIAITFAGDVHFWWFWYRWKAESQGFPSVQTRAPEDITIKSYGDFEFGPDFENFMKISKIQEIMQNP